MTHVGIDMQRATNRENFRILLSRALCCKTMLSFSARATSPASRSEAISASARVRSLWISSACSRSSSAMVCVESTRYFCYIPSTISNTSSSEKSSPTSTDTSCTIRRRSESQRTNTKSSSEMPPRFLMESRRPKNASQNLSSV